MVVVSLMSGENRYENVRKAMEIIEDELKNKIAGKKKIIVKPNFVSDCKQLAATHVDAVRAVLDFVTKYTDKKIIVAEGSAHNTFTGFKNFGYLGLEKEYNMEFFDLNSDKNFVEVEVFDSDMKGMKVKISKTMADSDCRISVGPMKVHNEVVATLSLKNAAVGSLLKQRHFPAGRYIGKALGKMPIAHFKDFKAAIHQGYRAINRNIFEVGKIVHPHISVIDGFEAMEGEGPVDGNSVKMGLAMAGTDFLAVDTVAAKLMGFSIYQIGYLHYCKQAKLGEWDLKKIEIAGNTAIEREARKFRPHPTFEEQLKWK